MGDDRLSCRQDYIHEVLVDISVDDDASEAFHLYGRPIVGLYVPVCNDTPAITFEVSLDEGVTWADLLDSNGALQAIEIQAGASAFFVSSDDLSPLGAYCGDLCRLRLVLSVAQSSDRTFYVLAMA